MDSLLHLIEKKRDGGELNRDEIFQFINDSTKNLIPDYQISSLLMAIFFRGMTLEETSTLTDAMVKSGIKFNFTDLPGFKVDKHSTGGVGDKISLIIAPIVAAAGVPVPMVSGRGLGHTGGTLDKLESIPGFKTDLSYSQAKELLKKHNIFFIGQTEELSPADRKLYALRDVTGTVESLPLITSSIMSKKIAEGIDALILDVKVGNGSFMKTLDRARELAKLLVETGEKNGIKTIALLTDMSQPLGKTIGNGLEVFEAIETLKGNGPADTHYLSLEIAGRMLCLGGVASSNEDGRKKAENILNKGLGLEKFVAIIAAQGGDATVVERPGTLWSGTEQTEVLSNSEGFISGFNCYSAGKLSVNIGAGRVTIDQKVDSRVGMVINKKIGDKVAEGELLMTFYHSKKTDKSMLKNEGEKLFDFSSTQTSPPKLILEEVRHE